MTNRIAFGYSLAVAAALLASCSSDDTNDATSSSASSVSTTASSSTATSSGGGGSSSSSSSKTSSSAAASGGGGMSSGDPSGVQAARAVDVLGGFGVNIHTTCCNPTYQDIDGLAADLNAIWGGSGVAPILRDSPIGDSMILSWWPDLAMKTGARFDAYIAELQPSAYQADLDLMRQLPHDIVFAYEGPNEPDSAFNNGICTGSKATCLQAAADFMPAVFAAGQADGVKVIQTSFGNNYPDPGDYGTTGDLSADADLGNAHIYFNTGHGSRAPNEGAMFGMGTISWLNKDAALTTPNKPIAITEYGYVVSGGVDAVTPSAQGVYVMEVIFDAFMKGNSDYFYYALYGDGSGDWGLYEDDHTPRAAANDLANLFAILGDAGAKAATFGAGEIDFTASGMPSGANPGLGGNSLLLAKSDGSFDLVLYNEQNIDAGEPAAVDVTVTFNASPKTVKVYDPTLGKTAQVSSPGPVSSMQVSLPAHPIVLSIE